MCCSIYPYLSIASHYDWFLTSTSSRTFQGDLGMFTFIQPSSYRVDEVGSWPVIKLMSWEIALVFIFRGIAP